MKRLIARIAFTIAFLSITACADNRFLYKYQLDSDTSTGKIINITSYKVDKSCESRTYIPLPSGNVRTSLIGSKDPLCEFDRGILSVLCTLTDSFSFVIQYYDSGIIKFELSKSGSKDTNIIKKVRKVLEERKEDNIGCLKTKSPFGVVVSLGAAIFLMV